MYNTTLVNPFGGNRALVLGAEGVIQQNFKTVSRSTYVLQLEYSAYPLANCPGIPNSLHKAAEVVLMDNDFTGLLRLGRLSLTQASGQNPQKLAYTPFTLTFNASSSTTALFFSSFSVCPGIVIDSVSIEVI